MGLVAIAADFAWLIYKFGLQWLSARSLALALIGLPAQVSGGIGPRLVEVPWTPEL